MDIAGAVNDVKAGKIDFKVDKYGIIHAAIGKVSFSTVQLVENASELLHTVIKMKPASAKGTYMKSCFVSSTMSAGVRIDIKSLA
jgi:large subunit ribosomal protein L1